MAKILKLSPHVADLIAAGEVVERPGSVITELVENSIDAGADTITVEIRSGGMTYMRVTDNGCGMSYEDSETAFLRHATSKLRDEHGLEAIGTLGFRGEALAATAAVSKIELITCERGAGEGTRLLIEGGVTVEKMPYGCPEGTTIIVRDLFYNTPARLKFMKSDKAEGSNISAVVVRCAISHPEISFRYIKDGKEEYHTPGDGLMESCMYSIFGRDFAGGMIKAESTDEGIAVNGFVSAPLSCRGNRAGQFFFVNGRFIRSKMLQSALEQAYKNVLFTGKFPSCILHITVSPAAVDVNVHPTKTEVKFLEEKKVFDGVYYAALGALGRDKKAAPLEVKAPVEEKTEKKEEAPFQYKISHKGDDTPTKSYHKGKVSYSYSGGFKTMGGDEFKKLWSKSESYSKIHASSAPKERSEITLGNNNSLFSYKTKAEAQTKKPVLKEEAPKTADTIPVKQEEVKEEVKITPTEAENYVEKVEKVPDFRVIGEALNTYIIAEMENSLYLIDKHAAHERLIFDRLREKGVEIMEQYLLTPLVIRVGSEYASVISEHSEVFSEFGFDIDRFGEDSVAVRQIPSEIDISDVESTIDMLCERLERDGKADADKWRDHILHVIACKAAVKAGKESDISQLKILAGKVLSGEVRFCPHGRPVMMELTKYTLDKNFKRV